MLAEGCMGEQQPAGESAGTGPTSRQPQQTTMGQASNVDTAATTAHTSSPPLSSGSAAVSSCRRT